MAALVIGAGAAELPSCESDTAAHCLGEDADMSREGVEPPAMTAALQPNEQMCIALVAGIAQCLGALGASGRSESCST